MDEKIFPQETKFYLWAEKEDGLSEEIGKKLKGISLVISDSITEGDGYAADIIMLYILSEKWGREAIRTIKTKPSLFLKPLLIFSAHPIKELREVVDEEIILPVSQITLDSKIEKLLSISHRLNELIDISEVGSQNNLKEILLLQFLYTRDDYLLNPIRNLASSLGYSYPLAQLLLDTAPGTEVELIEGLEENLLLKGKLVDKINLCPFCEHYQINFREVCPNCRSLNIKEESTIHHFRCAYVGREKEFRDGFVLRCPKCRKEIRHIGVDYDKPSEDLWCDDCGSNFSEPLVQCLCLHCAQTFSPEDTLLKLIKSFSLTPEGYRAAAEGILPSTSLMNILRKEIGFYTFEVFKELFRLEVLRCNRYQYDSTLVHLKIKNFREIIEQESISRARELRKEIAAVFKDTFRETDILTDISDNENLIIFTHTELEGTQIAIERLKERLNTLFKKKLDCEHSLLALQGETGDLESIWEKMK
jgi:GGDEF domain-containing protein